jgi:hypothetical protein
MLFSFFVEFLSVFGGLVLLVILTFAVFIFLHSRLFLRTSSDLVYLTLLTKFVFQSSIFCFDEENLFTV